LVGLDESAASGLGDPEEVRMRVKREAVPLAIRRRAARHIEAMRGLGMAVGAEAAQLADEACPVYRPDVRGVAYWELEITGVKATVRGNGDGQPGRGSGTGFLILSAGKHDVPIPHWSLELEPPSRALEAESGERGKVARVMRLDSLAYAAEDARGNFVAHIGQFPPRPTGLPGTLPKDIVLSSLEARPATRSENDRRVGKQQARRTRARALKPKVAPWPSWAQAKKGYAAAYKHHLKALRDRAAQAWEIEDLVEKFGEGIHEGDTVVVPLLAAGKAELTGDGAASVKMRAVDRQPPAVELTAAGGEQKSEQEFELRLKYDDGTTETLKFFVVPKGTPSNKRQFVPHPVPVLPIR
jgi:hypothetical protein